MAESKRINTRIINKHATTASWNQVANSFTPLQGEVLIFDTEGSETTPRIKVGTGSKKVGELPFIQEGMVDNNSITCSSDGKLSLASKYLDYLDNQLYQVPGITTFNIVGSNQEVSNTAVSISSFTHAESNVTNISGKLTLKRGSTQIATNISPSSSSATVSISDSFTPNSAQTVTYTLSGTNTKGTTFSKTDSITFYFPSFIGASTSANITNTSGLTKIGSASLAGTRSIAASTQYVYFISTVAIKSIKSGGFDVDYLQQSNLTLNINGVNKAYYVYRTTNTIKSTLSYVITT